MPQEQMTDYSRILIVDDNRAIHEDFKKTLLANDGDDELDAMEAEVFGTNKPSHSTQKFTLHSAYQGEEALKMVVDAKQNAKPYAMAFVDMRMPPGWDGIETIEKLWEVDPNMEIVVCTAYSDYSWTEMIDRLGQTDKLLILKKPFDTSEACLFAMALTNKRKLSELALIQQENLEAKFEHNSEQLDKEIEHKKQLESRLMQAQKLEAVGQLAAGIAHEINTPSQFVGDNLQFLKDTFAEIVELLNLCQNAADLGEPNELSESEALFKKLAACASAMDLEFVAEEIPEAIGQSIDGVHRISEIVRALKEFSHPGTTEKTAMDLNQAIRSTVTIAKNEWKFVANVETELDPDLPMIVCYPGELNQVVLNIVVNAAHAIGDSRESDSSPKGTITISTRIIGEEAEIRISDTGGGIPEEIRNRIFDPFFTTKDVGKGTGQGLAIAHDVIVNKHHGTIDIESEAGVGSAFLIRLPLNATNQETEAAHDGTSNCIVG